jgi:hypothetical protein
VRLRDVIRIATLGLVIGGYAYHAHWMFLLYHVARALELGGLFR